MNKQQWARFQSDKNRHEDPTYSATKTDEARFEKMQDLIRTCEINFSRNLKVLIDTLNDYAATETVVLLRLCARLSTVNNEMEFSASGTDEQAELWITAYSEMLNYVSWQPRRLDEE